METVIDSARKDDILAEVKQEIGNLIKICIEIEKHTPLVLEGEKVVEHLQQIEEFFDTLTDDILEIKNVIVALLENVLDE